MTKGWHAYVINLDGSDDRLAGIAGSLAAQGLTFTRIAAVDGRGRAPTAFDAYVPDRARRFYGRDLFGSEVACALSHIAALRAFLASDAAVCVIFEDDILLAPDFSARLAAVLDRLTLMRPGWGLLHLHPRRFRYSSALARVDDLDLRALHEFPVLTGGIAYTRQGAEAVLAGCTPVRAPWDVYLKDVVSRYDIGFGIRPALVTLAQHPSEIAQTTQASKEITGALGWWRKQRRIVTHELRGLVHMVRATTRPR